MLWKCDECKVDFKKPKSQVGKHKQYCSRTCYENMRLRFAKFCTCLKCGKVYRNPPAMKGDKYCSLKCYWESIGRMEDRRCQRCEKAFRPHSRGKTNRFCSLPCYFKFATLTREEFNKRRAKYHRVYRKAHPEWTKLQKNKRRSLEMGAEGNFTQKEWEELKNKHNQLCAHCGEKKKLTIDHIQSLSKGGSNYITNIQPLCGSCNSSKWIKELNKLKRAKI